MQPRPRWLLTYMYCYLHSTAQLNRPHDISRAPPMDESLHGFACSPSRPVTASPRPNGHAGPRLPTLPFPEQPVCHLRSFLSYDGAGCVVEGLAYPDRKMWPGGGLLGPGRVRRWLSWAGSLACFACGPRGWALLFWIFGRERIVEVQIRRRGMPLLVFGEELLDPVLDSCVGPFHLTGKTKTVPTLSQGPESEDHGGQQRGACLCPAGA
jgi:hypothetical protein